MFIAYDYTDRKNKLNTFVIIKKLLIFGELLNICIANRVPYVGEKVKMSYDVLNNLSCEIAKANNNRLFMRIDSLRQNSVTSIPIFLLIQEDVLESHHFKDIDKVNIEMERPRRIQQVSSKQTTEEKRVQRNFWRFFQRYHHAKGLQDYLDEYRYRFNRSFIKEGIFENLTLPMANIQPCYIKILIVK